MWETIGAPDEDGNGEVAAFPTDMEDGEEDEGVGEGPTEDIRLPPRRRRRRRRRRETSPGRRRKKRKRRSRYTH